MGKRKSNIVALINKWDLDARKSKGEGIALLSIPYGYKFRSCEKSHKNPRYVYVYIEKRKVKEVI
jgi:hypothetical protein